MQTNAASSFVRQVISARPPGFLLLLAALLPFALAGCHSSAGKRPLTLDAIYGPQKVDLDGPGAPSAEWAGVGAAYRLAADEAPTLIDAESGVVTTDAGHEALRAALAANGDFSAEQAADAARHAQYASRSRDIALIKSDQGLYVYRRSESMARKIAPADSQRKIVTLSPSGKFISFVRNENLYVISTDDGTQRQLTHDGSPQLLNGILDWIYQEEVYGRGDYRGHWWRDDDACIAYLQLDESRVPIHTIIDGVPTHPDLETMAYPKAGDPNPGVKLGMLDVATGQTRWIDLATYEADEPLVVYVNWAPDGKLLFQVQNRTQTWLDLIEADAASGATRRLLRETSPAWVNRLESPHWLADGSFLWLSERDGFRHLYHYARDGTLQRQVTTGEWEVRKLHGVDDAQLAYFTGTCDTSLEEHVYRVPLGGGAPQRLTPLGASHQAEFDQAYRYFIDRYSNIDDPPQVALRRADGALLRQLHANAEVPARDYRLGRTRFEHIPTRDGFEMNALLTLPPNYTALKRYPVLMTVYGGPDAQTVKNVFNPRADRWLEHLLASHGYVICAVDPRSASGKGARYAWTAYKQLGVQELRDLEDAAQWLVDRGIAHAGRIGITGFSYGGFMASYAVTHSDKFALAIAGGSVTDWRSYDSIYTERYMLRPAENVDGYDATSVVKSAPRLHGKLVLVHGEIDENVHMQNTVALIHALQNAGKQFDLMIYPKNRHGIRTAPRHFAELRMRSIKSGL